MIEITEKTSITAEELRPLHHIYAIDPLFKTVFVLAERDPEVEFRWSWVDCVSGKDTYPKSTSIANAVIGAKRNGLSLFATTNDCEAVTFVVNSLTRTLDLPKQTPTETINVGDN